MTPSHTITVPDDSESVRLDRFLVSVLPRQSRSQIQRLIREAHIRVDGREAKANQPVKPGQAVTVDSPDPIDPTPQPEAIEIPILYQDHDIIVVDKPAGMVVHPAAGHAGGTLVNALLHHVDDLSGIGGEKRPGIVHRLDRGTFFMFSTSQFISILLAPLAIVMLVYLSRAVQPELTRRKKVA